MHYPPATSVSIARVLHVARLFLLCGALVLVGCDSNGGGMNNGETTTISGRVTDNSSSGSSGTTASKNAAQDGVEGATVTAVRVGADGTTSALGGEATTNASGEFTLTVEGDASSVVRLNAEGENDFSSSVVVQVDGRNQVQAQPMTVETAAEADVYVEAKSEDDASSHDSGVMAADVATYVNADAAADISSGATQSSDVAAAIASSVEAESRMNEEAENGASTETVVETKANLYADLQSSLAAASSAEARTQAVTAFEDGMANLYVEAGASEEAQGESRQSSTSVMIEFSAQASSNAELGLRKQAELLRAEATARAQEAIFEAHGAGEATIDALVQARQQLKADIRAASSTSAMVDAHGTYRAEVEAQMEAAFDLSATAITAAESEIQGNVDTLFSALAEIGGLLSSAADVAVNSYSTFYGNAQTAAQASFETTADSEATAEAAARVLVFASAQGHSS